jgi:diamine N-acetyltransferase
VGASAVRLRPTTPADLGWVLAAEHHPDNAPFVTQWTRDQHGAALDDPDTRHLVIERAADGRAVGYVILAGLLGRGDGIELRRIVVTEKGRGHGRATLRLIKRMALVDLHAHRLWLDVRTNNPKAKHLYEEEGFVIEGESPDGLIILALQGEGQA